MVVEDLLRGPTTHVVAVVAPAVVVGHEPGIGFGLELADRGEVTAMEGRAPALLEDGAVEALDDGVVVGRAGRDPMVRDPLGHQGADEGAGDVFGTVVAQHGPDPYPVAPIGAQHLVDEAGRHGRRWAVPSTMATKAQRVKTSMAVSWYTLPTPLSLPM